MNRNENKENTWLVIVIAVLLLVFVLIPSWYAARAGAVNGPLLALAKLQIKFFVPLSQEAEKAWEYICGLDPAVLTWERMSAIVLQGSGEQEFVPDNLIYDFDSNISISGWFQRIDNFLDKGLEQSFQTYKDNVEREIAELATVRSVLGQDFAQKDELDLTWENHSAVMRELKRMQDEPGYVSAWEPKTVLDVEPEAPAAAMRLR